MESHDKIYEKLGNIESSVNWITQDAKKKNGYITDLDGRIGKVEGIIKDFKYAMEQTFVFMKEERDEKKRRLSAIGRFKAEWKLYIVNLITGVFIGTYLPLILVWLKKILKSG